MTDKLQTELNVLRARLLEEREAGWREGILLARIELDRLAATSPSARTLLTAISEHLTTLQFPQSKP